MSLENIDLDIGQLLLVLFAVVAVVTLLRAFRPGSQVREIGSSRFADKPVSMSAVKKAAPQEKLERKDRFTDKEQRATRRLGVKLMTAASLILVIMGGLFVSRFDEKILSLDVFTGKQSLPPAQTPSATTRQNRTLPSKVMKPAPAESRSGSERIPATASPLIIKPGLVNLSIKQIFNPVNMKIGAVSRPGSDALSEMKPAAIHSEPEYRGRPLYGYFAFGVGGQARFYFAFDQVRTAHPVLYLDRNRNGDLSDDGPPLNNKGSGRFATLISLPYAVINPEMSALGEYKFWFYTNKSLWPKKRASHYSRLQLTTELKIGEKWFHVWLAERGYNDADFTNDGLYIDVNQDDKIDTRTEHFATGVPIEIEGNKYIFLINNS